MRSPDGWGSKLHPSEAGGAVGCLCRKGSGWLEGTLDKSHRKLERVKVLPECEGDRREVNV